MWQCERCGRVFEHENQKHTCGETPATIDEYITAQSEDVRPILGKVRETIRAAAPDATERIAWRMPTFWQGENLIHFAAFKKHVGIYPGDLTVLPFTDQLADYKTTKGAIQFPYDKAIPYDLIAEITAFRVCAAKARASKKKERSNES